MLPSQTADCYGDLLQAGSDRGNGPDTTPLLEGQAEERQTHSGGSHSFNEGASDAKYSPVEKKLRPFFHRLVPLLTPFTPCPLVATLLPAHAASVCCPRLHQFIHVQDRRHLVLGEPGVYKRSSNLFSCCHGSV